MGLHKEGTASILISAILLALISFGFYELFMDYSWLWMSLATAAFLFWLAIVSFFRYPKLEVSAQEGEIICPADGKVVVIEKTQVDEFLHEERIQVSIFMSPRDTHMNRYPITGKVLYSKYHPGKHYVAWLPKSSTDNERTTVVVANDKFSIMLRQIAGAVARRIVCYAKEGDTFKVGDQLGFIKFGSRVDLFLPLNADIKVDIDQSVRAGKTLIASIT